MLEIEKRLKAIPSIRRYKVDPMHEVPWDDMKVGQSVFFRKRGQGQAALREKICTTKLARKDATGKAYSVRTYPHGIRLWRTN